MGDLQLFLDVERDARGLLAVPQRRVEDVDATYLLAVSRLWALCGTAFDGMFCLLLLVSPIPVALCGPWPAAVLFPPKGEEKKEPE
jgi:hypothetical protein